jgi:hypothetical protein
MRVRYSFKIITTFVLCENLVDSTRLTKEILHKPNIEIDGLYNLWKFMRHNMDLLSLKLNKDNLVGILFNVHFIAINLPL